MTKQPERWEVRKPTVTSQGGVVATQHHAASEAGARVLADGGNAVDAAVVASLALATVEPWMSGLGGGGFMLVRPAGEERTHAVSFGMVAPGALDPADYPLTGEAGADMFGWPAVKEDRNTRGPLAVAGAGPGRGSRACSRTLRHLELGRSAGACVRAGRAGHGGGLARHRRDRGIRAGACDGCRLRRHLSRRRPPACRALDRGGAACPLGIARGDPLPARRGRTRRLLHGRDCARDQH